MAQTAKSGRQKHAELDEEGRVLLWELGRRIVRLRKALNWSRGELAKRVGVSRERLGHWERGSHTPPLKGLVDLSRELGTSIDELVTGEVAAPRALSTRDRDEAARSFRDLDRCLTRLLGNSWDEDGRFERSHSNDSVGELDLPES
jgi:transcriptional regulator with XRE-family HTH domain